MNDVLNYSFSHDLFDISMNVFPYTDTYLSETTIT